MDDLLLQRFRDLLRARTGWNLGEQETERMREKVRARLKTRRVSPEAYYGLLEQGGAESAEWQELIALLANPETFFFRDAGQMALLKNRILPELIGRRRPHRSLRIWSAGCSTGEEPYSLAMLLHDLLPDHGDWSLTIIGTDVSREALQKARRGLYGKWSLRTVTSEPSACFSRVGAEWQLAERIRKMVTFRVGNLLEDPFPSVSSDLHEMDLILCRNVFIYFDRAAVAAVVPKFAATLREGGYLLTGHAELHDLKPPGLQPRPFPESLAHQRLADSERRSPSPSVRPAVTSPRPTPRPRPVIRHSAPAIRHSESSPSLSSVRGSEPECLQDALGEAERLLEAGACRAALEQAESMLRRTPGSFPTRCLAARAAAHVGDYPGAAEHCRLATEAAPFSPEPYYLLAQIAEHRGATREAAELLKKCLYLAPDFVPAYLELGDVYDRDGEPARGQKMRAAALEFLRAAPANARISAYAGVTAGELLAQLESLLAKSK